MTDGLTPRRAGVSTFVFVSFRSFVITFFLVLVFRASDWSEGLDADAFTRDSSDSAIPPLHTNQSRFCVGLRKWEESSSRKSQPRSGTKGPQVALSIPHDRERTANQLWVDPFQGGFEFCGSPVLSVIPDRCLAVCSATEIGAGREIMNRANVLAEKQVERPIEGDANFLVQARQFAQVNCAP